LRLLFAKEARGELKPGTAREWAHASNYKKLPERVKKRTEKSMRLVIDLEKAAKRGHKAYARKTKSGKVSMVAEKLKWNKESAFGGHVAHTSHGEYHADFGPSGGIRYHPKRGGKISYGRYEHIASNSYGDRNFCGDDSKMCALAQVHHEKKTGAKKSLDSDLAKGGLKWDRIGSGDGARHAASHHTGLYTVGVSWSGPHAVKKYVASHKGSSLPGTFGSVGKAKKAAESHARRAKKSLSPSLEKAFAENRLTMQAISDLNKGGPPLGVTRHFIGKHSMYAASHLLRAHQAKGKGETKEAKLHMEAARRHDTAADSFSMAHAHHSKAGHAKSKKATNAYREAFAHRKAAFDHSEKAGGLLSWKDTIKHMRKLDKSAAFLVDLMKAALVEGASPLDTLMKCSDVKKRRKAKKRDETTAE
jgi:hypothetical protein